MPAAELLALLDDGHVREILLTLESELKPAVAIAAACDCSRPTVYRRLKRLAAVGLVTVDLGGDGWSATVDVDHP